MSNMSFFKIKYITIKTNAFKHIPAYFEYNQHKFIQHSNTLQQNSHTFEQIPIEIKQIQKCIKIQTHADTFKHMSNNIKINSKHINYNKCKQIKQIQKTNRINHNKCEQKIK